MSGSVSSSNLDDSTDFVRGVQAVSWTSNGSGKGAARLERFGGAPLDLTGKLIRLQLKVDDVAHLSRLDFLVGTDRLANHYRWRFNATTRSSRLVQAGEWVFVTLSWAEVNAAAGAYEIGATGVPSVTSGFTDLRMQMSDDGTGQVTARLQSIEITDDVTALFPRGVVSITFDDGNESTYSMTRHKMAEHGFRGTQYVIADAVGAPGRVTLGQLHDLQDVYGWEVAGHAYAKVAHDARYPKLTAADVEADLRDMRKWLVANEFQGDSFAYPGGSFDATVDGTPAEQLVPGHFATGRTILSGVGTKMNILAETSPPALPFRLRALSSISSLATGQANPSTMLTAGGALDRCRRPGSWLILVFHRIVDHEPTATAQVTRGDFDVIMDGIAERGIEVLPVSEVIRTGLASTPALH
ncbi:hypothetical protein Psi02_23740 [Planotetraspora silvatica]|uniref:NodB homology domain-containing protein n=1 Tax=Planotetraspora silvatica TaxID=234614 RepID=A0A8J3XM72_9ACTN|nr:polysaccharide deacetylase family protein [Planotetraspora silvatica]GII45950.1 hypothetical protein Psi02_23740 [Planotetraspora silvatica]